MIERAPETASDAGVDPRIEHAAIEAQAQMHHALLLGLQLAVAMEHDNATVEAWMFRLFRRQHLEKFLASFEKLGLTGVPHAVACARYHVLSNSIGGVPVEYMAESDRKAWVRFRYPRWMYDGPTLCGVPVGVSRGFLKGWYAHNGVSLGNPRLGFVCVSEDMTGEFGLCGYFQEYDRELSPDERLRFARDELPPPFNADDQPRLPDAQWNETRLAKANRNYAVAYIRNGLAALAEVLDERDARAVATRAARLTGLQYYRASAARVGTRDGDARDAAAYLRAMLSGMGDASQPVAGDDASAAAFETSAELRILRDLEGQARDLVLAVWQALWSGAVRSHREMLSLEVTPSETGTEPGLRWRVFSLREAGC